MSIQLNFLSIRVLYIEISFFGNFKLKCNKKDDKIQMKSISKHILRGLLLIMQARPKVSLLFGVVFFVF